MRQSLVNRKPAVAPSQVKPADGMPAILLPQLEPEYAEPAVVDAVLDHRFEFCGERHDLGRSIRWLDNPSSDLEWQILLHKFYYTVALAERFRVTGDARLVACFVDLVTTWIAVTPPNFIAADVTARRIQNWLYTWYLLRGAGAEFPPGFEAAFKVSIEQQTASLIAELAPARNHRTLELYAVFLVGLALPDLAPAAEWREFAVRELTRNIRTDLLDDGVHCELAPDYHHIVLRNYLLFYRLCVLNGINVAPDIAARLCHALDFAMHVHRPDGAIPALSDSDSRSHRDLLLWGAEWFGRDDYRFAGTQGAAGRPPTKCNVSFAASGYHLQRSAWAAPFAAARYLVFDCGPIGAGNHGHIDALNIEVAAYGRPLIIDPGRFTYHERGEHNWRARFRGTAAHNTVMVDGLEQAVYRARTPGGKLKILEPRPRTRLLAAGRRGPVDVLVGSVVSPNYAAVHVRHVLFVRELYWLVIDVLRGTALHDYALNFQLTPAALAAVELRNEPSAAVVTSPGLHVIVVGGQAATRVEESFVSRRYGVKEPAPCVRVRRKAAATIFATALVPFATAAPRHACAGRPGSETLTVELEDRVDEWRFDGATVALRSAAGVHSFDLHGVPV